MDASTEQLPCQWPNFEKTAAQSSQLLDLLRKWASVLVFSLHILHTSDSTVLSYSSYHRTGLRIYTQSSLRRTPV